MQRKENEVKKEKEDADRWVHYWMLVHSRPLSSDAPSDVKKGRQEFIDSIRPEMKHAPKAPAQKFDWDMSHLERLKAMQGGE